MGTQKTGTTPPRNPQRDEIDRSPHTVTVAGRTLNSIDTSQLAEGAFAHMTGSVGDQPIEIPTTNSEMAQELSSVLPEFLKNQEEKQAATPEADLDKATLAALLSERAVEARKRGDDDLAEQLKGVLSQILGEAKPKRIRTKRTEHPALNKLKRNLGLKKIKPATIEWAGSKWHFAPAPPLVDNWVAVVVEQQVGAYSALKVSANLVGIDDAPLYEVLGIELVGTFEISGETMSQPLYVKECDACGGQVDVGAVVCPHCDSILDPFDMPLDLRMECTRRVHQFFVEDFGPYEKLSILFGLMRDVMPDRVGDRETLYDPFLKLSPTSSTETATSPSGAAP